MGEERQKRRRMMDVLRFVSVYCNNALEYCDPMYDDALT